MSPGTDTQLFVYDGEISRVSVSSDGSLIVCEGSKTVLFRNGNPEEIKSSGEFFSFDRQVPGIAFYSAWNEDYKVKTVWKMDFLKNRSDLLIFDQWDKSLAVPSGDSSFLAYINHNPMAVYVCRNDGNSKSPVFTRLDKKENVKALSWNYNSSSLMISTDKRTVIADFDIQREKAVSGSISERKKMLEDIVSASDFIGVRVIPGTSLKISCVTSMDNDSTRLAKVLMACYACLPEFRTGKLEMEIRHHAEVTELEIPISAAPVFIPDQEKKFLQSITWR